MSQDLSWWLKPAFLARHAGQTSLSQRALMRWILLRFDFDDALAVNRRQCASEPASSDRRRCGVRVPIPVCEQLQGALLGNFYAGHLILAIAAAAFLGPPISRRPRQSKPRLISDARPH